MFSEFVAQNSKTIHRGNGASPEESKKIGDKILELQKQAAQDYRKMKTAFTVKTLGVLVKNVKLMDRQKF